MVKTREFGRPCAAPLPGQCRMCGCSDADEGWGDLVGWADETRTLCNAPACTTAARAELTVRPDPSLTRPYDGPRYGFAPRGRR
jgi:hypothetical protein